MDGKALISPLALLAVHPFASAAVGQEKRLAVGEGLMGLTVL